MKKSHAWAHTERDRETQRDRRWGSNELGSLTEKCHHSEKKKGGAVCSVYRAEQRGGVTAYRETRRRCVVYSWMKEPGLGNLSRNHLCRERSAVNIQGAGSCGGHLCHTLLICKTAGAEARVLDISVFMSTMHIRSGLCSLGASPHPPH